MQKFFQNFLPRSSAVLLLTLASCDGGGGGGAHQDVKKGVEWVYDGTGIRDILVNGTSIRDDSMYYMYDIVAACSAADDCANLNSDFTDGHTLQPNCRPQPAGCEGSPYKINFEPMENDALKVDVTVGPLPDDYFTIVVGMGFRSAQIEEFLFADDGKGYLNGCVSDVQWEPMAIGFYKDIRLQCNTEYTDPSGVKHTGKVGVAEVKRQIAWGEFRGKQFGINRTLNGNYDYVHFLKNTMFDVHTFEVAWNFVPAGYVAELHEIIYLYPNNDSAQNPS